ncbi:MAG: Nicotinate phosphoribosyltransferase pncB2 [Chlamydiae bacterium]|nr:Nicotinate phosphoribosyltransferase pncB2 [Chlamydiota bacterium]
MQTKSFLRHLYRDSLGLLTDLYELTMAYSYWKEKLWNREAVFHLFFRKQPFGGPFALAAGIEMAIDYIQNFKFDRSDLDYLASLEARGGGPLFPEAFLKELEQTEIVLDVDAMVEGSVVFPYEPLMRVQGPIWQAQLMESALLNIVNFQTLIATKASRVVWAARGDHVVEFGLRRAQGIDGAIAASRAAHVGGCHSTSNVLAGKLFGIPVVGTHAHSWVMTFEDEKEAFSSFARAFPTNTVLLIDTYDTLRGVDRAIEVAQELRKEGIEINGVRLDSGDLARLSREVRVRLDAAGFEKADIMATNELDERLISDLKHQGAKINVWGVGTNLVTAKEQPALDGVYKLSAVQNERGTWDYRLKISEQVIKTTHPGISGVRRYFKGGRAVAGMLYDIHSPQVDAPKIIHHTDPGATLQVDPTWEVRELLVPMVRRGKLVYAFPPLSEMRREGERQLEAFNPEMRRFLNPQAFFAGMESGLYEQKLSMIEAITKKS